MLKIKSLSQNKLFLAFACGAFFSLAFAPFHFFVAAIISLSAFYF
jgi:apolipoprotein N-acyltransferase